jgi:hypothetical protein
MAGRLLATAIASRAGAEAIEAWVPVGSAEPAVADLDRPALSAGERILRGEKPFSRNANSLGQAAGLCLDRH